MDDGLEEVDEAELIRAFIEAAQIEMQTAMPCKVESYNKDKQTVEVVPALNRAMPDGQGNYVTEPLPKLSDVPVAFQRCKQFTITFPIVAGDYGLLVFCSRSHAVWRATGNQGDPGDLGMHTLDGAVFVPGLYPDASPAKTADSANMIVGSDTDGNSRIEFTPSSGINLGAGASKGVARSGDPVSLGLCSVTVVSGVVTKVTINSTDLTVTPTEIDCSIKSGSAHIKAVD